ILSDQRLDDATQVIAYLDKSELSLSEPADYTSADADRVATREAYGAFLTDLFGLLGQEKASAASSAAEVLAIETDLARACLAPSERRDRRAMDHVMSREGLRQLAPSFPWKIYFAAIGVTPDTMNVSVPPVMKAIETLLTGPPASHAMSKWKSYCRWQLLR